MKNSTTSPTDQLNWSGGNPEQEGLLPTFGENFLVYHAASIITDPRHAVVELVANCWDAGADRVEIEWPEQPGGRLTIRDNGTGMTKDEFLRRWRQLNYNRLDEQGNQVRFPEGTRKRKRLAFGRNGVGRHAMFWFSTEYRVETASSGNRIVAQVKRSVGRTPFDVKIVDESPADTHGTSISTVAHKVGLTERQLVDLVGSRFVADPEFRIVVNGTMIELTHLDRMCETSTVEVEGVGTFIIRRYDSEVTGRTSKQNGLAWWVNNRLVGDPSWEIVNEPLVDSRTSVAKRFVYVIEADPLTGFIKPDWSGFYAAPEVNTAQRAIAEHVRDDLRSLLSELRRERKREVLAANRTVLRALPTVSQVQIARFAEAIQERSPTISSRDLEHAVEVLANLERSRTGYSLLEKLAGMDVDDLDGLDAILDEWSIQDAREVLDELRYRLQLIRNLERLVESHTADELHDLQPLFERGLWIFGPAFESISFTSNRTLSKVVEKLFGDAVLKRPKDRPDFVALPDASIGLYSSDAYDESHEVCGLAAVVIVELKRGGFTVTSDEKDQAMRYAREIRKSGKVDRSTKITAYVLGTTRDEAAEDPSEEGNTRILARTYGSVLRQAHARTFNLLQRVEGSRPLPVGDPELDDALAPAQLEIDPNFLSSGGSRWTA